MKGGGGGWAPAQPTSEAINNAQGAEGQGVPGRGSDSGHAPHRKPDRPTPAALTHAAAKGKYGQQFARGDLCVRTRTGLPGTWRSLPRPRTKQATHAPCTRPRHTGHPRPLQPRAATQRRPHRVRPVTAVVATAVCWGVAAAAAVGVVAARRAQPCRQRQRPPHQGCAPVVKYRRAPTTRKKLACVVGANSAVGTLVIYYPRGYRFDSRKTHTHDSGGTFPGGHAPHTGNNRPPPTPRPQTPGTGSHSPPAR